MVISKRHDQFVEIKNFGTAETDEDVNRLYGLAQKWLMTNGGQQSIDFDDLRGREFEETKRVIDNMDAAIINGTQLLLTQIYDSIGFNRIHDEVLRHLVIARVSQPMSKLATVEYLKSYYDEDVDLNHIFERKRDGGERLIVGYSDKRAKKDAYNRERGVARLRKAYSSGKLTKAQVNRRGYNKFLEISKDIQVSISEDKINEDEKWDGLKGYITNTDLDVERVVAQYHGLWVVEKAFRISKGTLDMRPMFHFTERRIEAHVCICFVALRLKVS